MQKYEFFLSFRSRNKFSAQDRALRTKIKLSRCLIIFYTFDEGEVVFFAGAKGIAFGGVTLVIAVAYAGAESQRFGFGVETFGFVENDVVIILFRFFEIGIEAIYVVGNYEINQCGVGNDVNFYWHIWVE